MILYDIIIFVFVIILFDTICVWLCGSLTLYMD